MLMGSSSWRMCIGLPSRHTLVSGLDHRLRMRHATFTDTQTRVMKQNCPKEKLYFSLEFS